MATWIKKRNGVGVGTQIQFSTRDNFTRASRSLLGTGDRMYFFFFFFFSMNKDGIRYMRLCPPVPLFTLGLKPPLLSAAIFSG